MTNRLYEQLIHYAGVFPPAEHTIGEALMRYRKARSGSEGWILGPFLIQSSQLSELANRVPDQLGVVVDASLPDPPPPIDQVESRAVGDVDDLVQAFRRYGAVVYLEAAGSDPSGLVSGIAATRRGGIDVRAKLRTGGPTPESFPPVATVAEFIRRCVAERVPFKATAGLHHPFRTPARVAGATEHGFINMLAAVRVALCESPHQIEKCLADEDPAAFDSTTATWQDFGAHIDPADIRAAFTGFGSCSFEEPAEHLRTRGVL